MQAIIAFHNYLYSAHAIAETFILYQFYRVRNDLKILRNCAFDSGLVFAMTLHMYETVLWDPLVLMENIWVVPLTNQSVGLAKFPNILQSLTVHCSTLSKENNSTCEYIFYFFVQQV